MTLKNIFKEAASFPNVDGSLKRHLLSHVIIVVMK